MWPIRKNLGNRRQGGSPEVGFEEFELRRLLAADLSGSLGTSAEALIELNVTPAAMSQSPIEMRLTEEDVLYYQRPNGTATEFWWYESEPQRLLTTEADIQLQHAYGSGDNLFLAYNHREVLTDLPDFGYQDGIDTLKTYHVSERLAHHLLEPSFWTNDNMFTNEYRFVESEDELIILHDEIDSDLVHTRFWATNPQADEVAADRIGTETFTALFQNAVDRVVASAAGGYVFDGIQFNVNGGDQQQGVWSLDLDDKSTKVIKNFATPLEEFEFSPRGVRELTSFADQVYFVTNDGASGFELWTHDGTATELFADVNESGNSNPSHLTVVDDSLFFFADDGTGNQLWSSDGFAVPEPLRQIGKEDVVSATAFSDHLVFFTQAGENLNVWRSDGTAAGSEIFASLQGTMAAMEPVVVGNRILFQFDDGVHGLEWWVSDGTKEGTQIAVDIRSGVESSLPQKHLVRNNELLFVADDGDGFDIWKIEVSTDAGSSLPGDTNNDSRVNFVDFLVVSKFFGRTVQNGIESGDFNEDGSVNFVDFLIVSKHFGRTK